MSSSTCQIFILWMLCYVMLCYCYALPLTDLDSSYTVPSSSNLNVCTGLNFSFSSTLLIHAPFTVPVHVSTPASFLLLLISSTTITLIPYCLSIKRHIFPDVSRLAILAFSQHIFMSCAPSVTSKTFHFSSVNSS